MTWIHFSRDEAPAPSLPLFAPDGQIVEIADFRGISNLVVFFAHGWECQSCRSTIQRFSEARQRLDARLLADVDHRLQTRFAGLLEFELPGELMLFVLNSSTSPVRAWVGEEASEIDLVEKAEEALDYITLQCPE